MPNINVTKHQLVSQLPLETNRLIIRKVEREDATELFATYTSDSRVTAMASWKTHTSIEDAHNFLQYCLDKWDASEEFNMSICLKDQPLHPIGMLKIEPAEKFVKVGYVLAEKYWNQGLTTEAVSNLCHLLFSFPQVSEIQAFTDPQNLASIAVLKKVGFQYTHRLIKHIVRPQISSEPRDSVVFSLYR